MLRSTIRCLAECDFTILESKVAKIVLNRPDRRNAFGRVMSKELLEGITACANPANGVRALVITSAVPGTFSAGADLKERKEMSPEEARAFVNGLRSMLNQLEDLEIPTISAIDGVALGGGLELSLATDIRIASEKSKIGLTETGLAIVPGAGGTFRLPRAVGLSQAMRLICSGVSIDGNEALRIGLVQELAADPGARAVELAEKIGSNGPIAVRAAKMAMKEGYQKDRDVQLAAELKAYEKVLPTKDRLEGLKAFAEKRKPQYQGH